MSSNFPSLLFSRQWQGGGFLMVPNSSLTKIVQVVLGDMVQGAGNIPQLHRTWPIIKHCEVWGGGVTVKKGNKKTLCESRENIFRNKIFNCGIAKALEKINIFI